MPTLGQAANVSAALSPWSEHSCRRPFRTICILDSVGQSTILISVLGQLPAAAAGREGSPRQGGRRRGGAAWMASPAPGDEGAGSAARERALRWLRTRRTAEAGVAIRTPNAGWQGPSGYRTEPGSCIINQT